MVVNGKYGWALLLLFGCFSAHTLAQPNSNIPHFKHVEKSVDLSGIAISQVPVYSGGELENSVLLENGYAKYDIINAEEWPPQGQNIEVTKIEIVFTQYPKKYDDWITNYDFLLSKRLSALQNLDSKLISQTIEYEIVLQTDCENEFEAMQLFHGVRIHYQELETTVGISEEDQEPLIEEDTPKKPSRPSLRTQGYLKKIRQFMTKWKGKYHMDSTVFKVLERNEWQNAHIVTDWTGSMYGYGAEALLWHTMKESASPIRHLTFFNDGDQKKNRKKMLGSTGGIYTSNATSISKLLRLIKKVKNKGNGGDSPENDVEALIAALNEHPDEAIVLIADNNSCIRDYVLLKCLDRPIHVILCGTRKGINHQYLNLAWKTGGSVHTKTMDIDSIDHELRDGRLQICTVFYSVMEEDRILPVDRSLDRFQYCNRYYRNPKRKKRGKVQKIDCD